MNQDSFRLGVNYWPRRKAMYWWSDFDPGEVKGEFQIIREIGLDLVRIFLLWEDWQPTPNSLNPETIEHLETVCDLASDLGLSLDITFFIGHMSGPSWTPSWMLLKDQPLPKGVNQVVSSRKTHLCGYANPYTDPVTIRAAELLLERVVSAFHDHPAILYWNLGNEPDLFAKPPNASIGRSWVRRMVNLIKKIDQEHPVTCGLHVPNLIEDNGLRVNEVFAEVDFAAIHGYPMYADWAEGPLDLDFVPFICALTAALCGKPVLMEEFGGPTEAHGMPSKFWSWEAYGKEKQQFVPSEEDLAEYVQQTLPKLIEAGAIGAVIWCFTDYSPTLYDRPPCDEARHERFFGLMRPDGSLKPHAIVLQQFAASRPKIQPSQRKITLDIAPETYYQNPLQEAIRLYKLYKSI